MSTAAEAPTFELSTLAVNDLAAAFQDATGQHVEADEVQVIVNSVGFRNIVFTAAAARIAAVDQELAEAQQAAARKDAELAQVTATLEQRAAIAPVGEDLPTRTSPESVEIQADGSAVVSRAGSSYVYANRDMVQRAYSDALAAYEAYLRKDAEDAAAAKARAELVARIAAAPVSTGAQLGAEQINAALDLIAAAGLVVTSEPARA
jgi:hypothetical protein